MPVKAPVVLGAVLLLGVGCAHHRPPDPGEEGGGGLGLTGGPSAPPVTRDRDEIRRTIREQALPRARVCHERLLARDPTLQGDVRVSFAIEEDGTVRDVLEARDASGAPREPAPIDAVAPCLLEVLRQVRFRAARGAGLVAVQYPFRFRVQASSASEEALSEEAPVEEGMPPCATSADCPEGTLCAPCCGRTVCIDEDALGCSCS